MVVDGQQLLLTPLRLGLVPPPMCAATAQLPGAVVAMAVGDDGQREVLAAVMSGGQLALLRSVEEELWEETLEVGGGGGGLGWLAGACRVKDVMHTV